MIVPEVIMYIPRYQMFWLNQLSRPGQILLIQGGRHLGKTTLIKEWYAAQTEKKHILLVSGNDHLLRQTLSNPTPYSLAQFAGLHKTIVIDEAQAIPEIGSVVIKLAEEMPILSICILSSTELILPSPLPELVKRRLHQIQLLPLAQQELKALETPRKTVDLLPSRLLYGSYPEVLTTSTLAAKQEYLRETVGSQLLRDIIQQEGLRKAGKLLELLKLLAWQIGREASQPELGSALGLNKMTVERYLELLQKAGIIYPRSGFGSHPHKEITKSKRWYFVDNGILNAVTADFRPLELRPDLPALWENYLLSERQKLHNLAQTNTLSHFWKTYQQQSIDVVEVNNGSCAAYDLRWTKPVTKLPSAWKTLYPQVPHQCITRENYLEWITG
jgi:predicted AAA+ superfamily ATPase